MLTTLSLDSEAEMKEWDEFVQSHPRGSPYHLSPWLRILSETYNFEPFLYALKQEGGGLRGVLPFLSIRIFLTGTRIVSLPFSDYGGPLLKHESEAGEFLKEVIERHRKKGKYIEIRGPGAEGCGFVCHSYYKRHVMDLGLDLGAMRKKIDKRTIQYSIRKAERMAVRIEEGKSEADMEEFCRLNLLTRKKHGVPSQPKKFFKLLYREMISKGHGFLLLAIHDSKVVAGSLFLKSGSTIHYKYNASDPEVLGKITPNHSLTWHACVMGHEAGFKALDFGRTSPDNEGLTRYKEMWGASCHDLPYYHYPVIRGASSREEKGQGYRIATGLWRKSPDFIAERLGPIVYRRMA